MNETDCKGDRLCKWKGARSRAEEELELAYELEISGNNRRNRQKSKQVSKCVGKNRLRNTDKINECEQMNETDCKGDRLCKWKGARSRAEEELELDYELEISGNNRRNRQKSKQVSKCV